ncbi:MAG: hypothetical protein RLZZ283_283 [Candidatus Parcubacteria bacterium]|jgi:hypothetical protein
MSKAVIVVIIGILLVLLPYLGVPSAVKTFIIVGTGTVLVILGLLMRVERLWLLRALHGGHANDAYAESGTRHDPA